MVDLGDCVKIPDGRIGRVRARENNLWKIRVKREKSNSHKFMYFRTNELKVINCPKGWMSPEGYNSYVEKTLYKMKKRLSKKRSRSRK